MTPKPWKFYIHIFLKYILINFILMNSTDKNIFGTKIQGHSRTYTIGFKDTTPVCTVKIWSLGKTLQDNFVSGNFLTFHLPSKSGIDEDNNSFQGLLHVNSRPF